MLRAVLPLAPRTHCPDRRRVGLAARAGRDAHRAARPGRGRRLDRARSHSPGLAPAGAARSCHRLDVSGAPRLRHGDQCRPHPARRRSAGASSRRPCLARRRRGALLRNRHPPPGAAALPCHPRGRHCLALLRNPRRRAHLALSHRLRHARSARVLRNTAYRGPVRWRFVAGRRSQPKESLELPPLVYLLIILGAYRLLLVDLGDQSRRGAIAIGLWRSTDTLAAAHASRAGADLMRL